MNHGLVSKIWAYNPTTGDITRNGAPVQTLWFPDKNPICGYRCQAALDGANYTYKAEHVAWCLLTGKDLPKAHKPQHINGDKRDNRAANLYLEIENEQEPWFTFVMADTPLSRLIYTQGTKTGETWTAHQIYGQQEPLHDNGGLGEQYRAHLVLQQGARPAGPEFLAAWKKTPIDSLENFAAWIVQKRRTDACFTGLAPKGFHL